MTNSLKRWIAPVGLALVMCVASGCASTPQGHEMQPAGETAADLKLGAQLHDSLVAAAQGAAVSITGNEVEASWDVAAACLTGEGTRFQYSISFPAEAASEQNYARVAEIWEEQGINVNIATGPVNGSGSSSGDGPGSIANITLSHFDARGPHLAQYTVEGFSVCLPGSPTDYYELTGQLTH